MYYLLLHYKSYSLVLKKKGGEVWEVSVYLPNINNLG